MAGRLTPAQRKQREYEAKKANEEYARNKEKSYERSRFGARIHLPVLDGCIFIVSDQHYWPTDNSLAHRAALKLAKRLRPWAIISNGDSLDGATISRWGNSSFIEMKGKPTVEEELVINKIRLNQFEDLKSVRFTIWNLGNHDARYETYLATHVEQFAGVQGFTLKDHFPGWLPAWSTYIGDQLVVKHRFKGGQYAAANNALWSGRSYVTGHDHMLWVKPITDLNGTRFGAAAGTLADIYSEQFLHYTEDNPVNWQSGFLIAHFRDEKLTGLEPVHCLPDGRVLFRGDVLKGV